jgi:hypothetical protein
LVQKVRSSQALKDGHAFMRLFRRREAGAFLEPVSVPFFVAIISIKNQS